MLLHVVIDRILHFKESSGWFVALTEDNQKVTGVSFFPPEGEVTLEGEWTNHTEYGEQFKANRIIYGSALDVMRQLLGSGFLTGVKKAKAVKMVETLGERTFEVLDACLMAPMDLIEWNGQMRPPEAILQSVNGIKTVVASQILEAWKARRDIMNAAIMGMRAGLTAKQFREALGDLGEEVLIDSILNNPYKLTTVDGISFADADLISKLEWEEKAKIPDDSPLRLGAAVREVINMAKDTGHMALPLDRAMRDAVMLVAPMSEDTIWNAISSNLEELDLVYVETNPLMITTTKNYTLEYELATHLQELIAAPFKKEEALIGLFQKEGEELYKQHSGGLELTDLQKNAIWLACTRNVTIITGGPGTGKTTIIKTLVNILDEAGISYTLSSFIAKVAIRMQEATGRSAGTLHSIFEIYKDRKDWMPLYDDYLIIDETSTLNVELMHDVISLVKKGQRVVFVGDSNQLPPIGPGEPFTQLQKVIPSIKLDKIFRQADTSGIVLAAHKILGGGNPQSDHKDFFNLEYAEDSIPKKVVEMVTRLNQRSIPYQDIQVLSSINAGRAGRTALNLALQQFFNPYGQPITINDPKGLRRLRVGDKVIHTKNNPYVKNGEVGYIIKAEVQQALNNEGGMDLELQDGTSWDGEKPVLWVQYPMHDQPTPYTNNDVKNLQLGYCITVHKSIGSEYTATIVVLPWTRQSHMTRQLVYTGATRAKKICVLVGSGNSVQAYIENSVRERRWSLLANLMEEVKA